MGERGAKNGWHAKSLRRWVWRSPCTQNHALRRGLWDVPPRIPGWSQILGNHLLNFGRNGYIELVS
jgi:hypothetical protein